MGSPYDQTFRWIHLRRCGTSARTIDALRRVEIQSSMRRRGSEGGGEGEGERGRGRGEGGREEEGWRAEGGGGRGESGWVEGGWRKEEGGGGSGREGERSG